MDWTYGVLGSPSTPSEDIVLLVIDSKSLVGMLDLFEDRPEPWPWQRLVYGAVADFLRHAGARAVAFDLDLSGPSPHDVYTDDSTYAARALGSSGIAYLALSFKRLEAGEGADAVAGGAPGAARLDVGERVRLPFEEGRFDRVLAPYGPLSDPATSRGLGAVNAVKDPSGTLRRAPLLVRFEGSLYPSLALSVFRDVAAVRSVAISERGELLLDDLRVPLDDDGRYRIHWYGPERTFPSYTFHEAVRMALADYERRCPEDTCADPLYWNHLGYSGMIGPEQVDAYAAEFRDKIVLVGVNASELGDVWANPFSEAFPGVEAHATILSNLLSGEMLRRPPLGVRVGILGALALALGLGVAALGGESRGLVLLVVGVMAYLALYGHVFWSHLLRLDLAVPLGTGGLAYAGVTLVHYFGTGRLKRRLRRTFDRVLQPELVELLLREPRRLELGGETRSLTVLFSDLKDFTGIAERLSAGELVDSLNAYFSRFAELAIARGAYIDKYIGDGVLAVWGAPTPNERHATAACLAALDLRSELDSLPWELLQADRPRPQTRIGIESGHAVAGMVGSRGAAHYTVMGDVVVTASRLEGANKVYGTSLLIGEGCHDMVRSEVLTREIDLVVLKGQTRPVRVFEPLCRVSEESPVLRERVDIFARGLERYRGRQWHEARELLERSLELDPADGPARVLSDRCVEYAQREPPPTWSGEFVMAVK